MEWLQSVDLALFRLINLGMSHPWLDLILPFLSSNDLFPLVLLAVGGLLVWKGGRRERTFVFCLVVAVALVDGVICQVIKEAAGRERPFVAVPEANLLVGRGRSGSMPSSHMANWAAGTMVAYLFYSSSWRFFVPASLLIGFSRVYLGVHYPGDVLVGAIVGAGVAWLVCLTVERVWRLAGPTWFPLWWAKAPSLVGPSEPKDPLAAVSHGRAVRNLKSTVDSHWVRLGCVIIGVLLLLRLLYLSSDTIELTEDEAYQWLWSKHPALSYFSKPPLIAYTQFAGTSLWGDTEFGVRFFSPVIAAILSVMVLRFMASEASAQAGFWLVLITAATPLLAVGSILMTIDPLSVLFWTAAMLAGWRAVKQDSTVWWCWTGLWMGLGFLSKYVALFQWVCWAVFFALWKPARAQLRRPGPYVALGINLVLTLPVLIWNARNDWITLDHLADRGGLDEPWRLSLDKLRYFGEFLGAEFGLLNPVFFVGGVWAAIAFWRRRTPLMVFLFSMGAPLFLFYLGYTIRDRVQPNWIAPSVVPLFCLMALYWETRLREGTRAVQPVLAAGLVFGLTLVVVLHDTDLVTEVAGRPLPVGLDPLRRARGAKEMGRIVSEARTELLKEGKPVFIIGQHYGVTSLLTFYIPEAKARVPDDPLVYYQSTDVPKNQFYFWPGYEGLKGWNAIYVQEVKRPRKPPERLFREFASVNDLGMRDVLYDGRVLHRVQLFECRRLQ